MDFVAYILVASGAPIVASLLPLLICRKGFTPRLVGIMLGVSAGVLFSIATLDLIPEAIKMGLDFSAETNASAQAKGAAHDHDHDHEHGQVHNHSEEHQHNEALETNLKIVLGGIGAGFLLLLVIEQIVTAFGGGHSHSHNHGSGKDADEQSDKKRAPTLSFVALVGLGIHSFFDGLIIAGAFAASTQVGSHVALAIILHKFPDGLVLSSLVASSLATMDSPNTPNSSGNSPPSNSSNALSWKSLYSILAVCAATPIGAFFGRVALAGIPKIMLAFFLSFCSGSFLYITTIGILPEILRTRGANNLSKLGALISLVAGYLGFLAVGSLFGHPH